MHFCMAIWKKLYTWVNTTHTQMGFLSSVSDASLFKRFHKGSILLILIYVNDILATGNNATNIKSLIPHLLTSPCKLSLTLNWVPTPMITNQHQATVFISATTSSHGLPRSKKWYHQAQWSISHGYNLCYLKFILLFQLRSFTVIINLGVFLLTTNPVMHSQTKHFELDLHFIHNKVNQKQVFVHHIPASFQIADTLTKPIFGSAFHDFPRRWMLRDLACVSFC